jgi:hypothetical protein
MIAAVAGAVLLAINGGATSGFAAPAMTSAVFAMVALGVIFQATTWLVVWHGRDGPRTSLGLLAGLAVASVAASVATGHSLSSRTGLAVLGAVAVVSAGLAFVALQWVPVERLWKKAAALESMRSSMQTFDFQRVLLDMRRAGGRPQPARVRLVRRWMPLPVWRLVASMQHGGGPRAMRLVAVTIALATIVMFADAREGLVLVAIAACSGFIGFEFSGPLAATADQLVFVVHYRRGSSRILWGQLAVMMGASLAIAGLALGWQWGASSLEVQCAAVVCGYGALGAAVQARLGSPNLGAFVDVMGFAAIGPLLWARAMLGPAVLMVGTVALSHQWLRPSDPETTIWGLVALTAALAGVAIATWPLEKGSS